MKYAAFRKVIRRQKNVLPDYKIIPEAPSRVPYRRVVSASFSAIRLSTLVRVPLSASHCSDCARFSTVTTLAITHPCVVIAVDNYSTRAQRFIPLSGSRHKRSFSSLTRETSCKSNWQMSRGAFGLYSLFPSRLSILLFFANNGVRGKRLMELDQRTMSVLYLERALYFTRTSRKMITKLKRCCCCREKPIERSCGIPCSVYRGQGKRKL